MNPQSDGDCLADQRVHQLTPSGGAYHARCLQMNDLGFCSIHNACEVEQWSLNHASIAGMSWRTNDP